MKIREIHQIEVTSRCNLKCRYCVHPSMTRPKIDMDYTTFCRAIKWVKYFSDQGAQKSLNLAGIGESTIHPNLEYYLEIVREALPDLPLVIATNGIEIVKQPQIAEYLFKYRCAAFVSLHRPEMAGPAIEILRQAGCYAGSSSDPATNAVDWAGQVDWHVSSEHKGRECAWLNMGQSMVLSDGRVTTCSFDSTGAGVIGNVYDDLSKISVKPYELCKSCHYDSSVRIPLAEAV